MVVITLLVLFFGTIFTQLPVAIVIGFSSMCAVIASGTYPLTVIVSRMFSGIDSFVLLAIPMFILAGSMLNESGATERLFDFADSLVGRFKGGLGHTNVVASMIFAGISGSAVADAAGLGRVEIAAMTKKGYSLEFSSAITIASSVIGPIIPPSIPMVIYGAMTGESVVKLFAGGLIPGVMMGILLMVMVYIIAVRTPGFPPTEHATLPEIWRTFKEAILPLLAPIIILGGIFSGFYTPTEASVAAVVYVFAVEMFIYRKLKFPDYKRIFLGTIIDSGVIIIIISTASAFGWLLAIEKIPNMLTDALLAFSSPIVIMIMINLLLLFLGCFIEGLAIMVILIPVLVPLTTQLGYSPIHFGIIMVVNVMIGVTTPPLGMCLFVVSNITKVPVWDLAKAMGPFYISLVLVLVLILFVPQTVMFLPNLF